MSGYKIFLNKAGMGNSTENKIKLIVFVLISTFLFGTGIYFVGKKQQLFNTTYRLTGIFKDAGGLEKGNNVRFSGINVGTVESVKQISDSTIKIDMQINSEFMRFMRKNIKATIGSDGLMGNRIVILNQVIIAGQKETDDFTIETAETVEINDILVSLKATCDNAANISCDLSAITAGVCEGKGTIGKLFMDSVLAQNLEQTLTNIKQAAGGFEQNMNAARKSIFLRGYFRKKSKDGSKGVQKKNNK